MTVLLNSKGIQQADVTRQLDRIRDHVLWIMVNDKVKWGSPT